MEVDVTVTRMWRQEKGGASLPQGSCPKHEGRGRWRKACEGRESGPMGKKREHTISKVKGRELAVSRGWSPVLRAAGRGPRGIAGLYQQRDCW